ncbi:MAG: phosphoenolpyruvate--protein phosphotransferase [Deltaproteobacteria bacterium]|nr:phosphoenolpyruvate--protein phosphotransferase [Deltaproteobacteria bacterium]MBW2070933.1 phosphoenolpyruvate--protein phosphotransferase [Deltaproteobacteria bacterium]
MPPGKARKILKGIGVTPGIAIGKAYQVDRNRVAVVYHHLPAAQTEQEVRRFAAAVDKAEIDLQEIKSGMAGEFPEHVYILDSHLHILRDRMLYDETIRFIREHKVNAEWAVKQALENAHRLFARIEDEYIRSRISDVDYVAGMVLGNLTGQKAQSVAGIKERVIIVAHDLSPADTMQLQVERTLGFVTDMGGKTSHTAIIARSLDIPAVVGLEAITREVRSGELMVVDGTTGTVIIDPDEELLNYYYERQYQVEAYRKELTRCAALPAETEDGFSIRIQANIELLEEVVAVLDNGAEGIGLYRTEYLYLNRQDLPDEDTLFWDYREVAEIVYPEAVTIRTLDLGAEKLLTGLQRGNQTNPALGLRAIRLCLQENRLFRTQLRAILRVSAVTDNVRLMFPMISGLGELRAAKDLLAEVRQSLQEEGIRFSNPLPVGIMIEVPSAVAVADLLAREVDFFSIGTNDLVQYALAIDRVNEHVAHLYEPLHPAILRMIKQVTDAGHRAGIPVSLCGEMAGEPLYAPILLGFELDSLSMNALAVPRVKQVIRNANLEECKTYLRQALNLSTAEQINAYLREIAWQRFREDFEFFPAELGKHLDVDFIC